jgi:hypothetical protein
MLRYKRLLILLFSILLICCMSITAFAVDQDKTGSIEVTMKYNGSAVSGGTLTIYRVGDAQKEADGYKYTLTEDFAGSGAVLETEESADTAKSLANYASNKGINGTTSTIDTYGKVSFKELEIGVYLIVQNRAASGYEKITPFLVNIPMLLTDSGTNAASTDNEIYDVEASPKMSRKASSSSSSSSGSRGGISPTPTPKVSITSSTTPTSTPKSSGTPVSTDDPSPTDVPDSGTVQETEPPSGELTPQGEEPPSSGSGQQDVVITPKLPQTGQLNWPIPVLVIFGLVVFSIGWNLRFGKIRRR